MRHVNACRRALGLAWLANRARIQREAVAAIERTGGKAWYDWEWQNDAPVPDASTGWPAWLVEAITTRTGR